MRLNEPPISIIAKLVYTKGTPGSRFKSNPLLGIILIIFMVVPFTSASVLVLKLISLLDN